MTRHHNPRDRANAVQWAQDLLQKRSFYVLDTETTGVGKSDEVVQVGIIDQQGETVINTLVKPTRPISAGASAVNGITNAMVANAPSFMDLYTDLSRELAGSMLIAYNMDFDWRLLRQSAQVYRLPMFRANTHCAMKQYAAYRGVWNGKFGNYRWHKLTAAAEYEGIQIENAHTALGDVLMTLALIKKMAEA